MVLAMEEAVLCIRIYECAGAGEGPRLLREALGHRRGRRRDGDCDMFLRAAGREV